MSIQQFRMSFDEERENTTIYAYGIECEYLYTLTEDENENWGAERYNTVNGYSVVHVGIEHHIYFSNRLIDFSNVN